MRGIGMEGFQENRTSRDEWLRTPGTGGMRPSLMAAENQERIKRESKENHGDQLARELLCAELFKNCDK